MQISVKKKRTMLNHSFN